MVLYIVYYFSYLLLLNICVVVTVEPEPLQQSNTEYLTVTIIINKKFIS